MLNGPNWHIYPKRFARFHVYLKEITAKQITAANTKNYWSEVYLEL